MSEKTGQGAPQTSAESVCGCDAHIHDILNATAAAIINAEAALNWLRARPTDLKEIERALNRIVSDGRRASEVVNRLRAEVLKASR